MFLSRPAADTDGSHFHFGLVEVTTGFDGEPGACSGRINQH